MAGGLSLSKRRYAYTVGHSFPYLKPPDIPGQDALGNAQFFANFEILTFITSDYSLYDSSQTLRKASRWARTEWDPALDRMNPELIDVFYRKKTQIRSFIEVPSDNERAAKYTDETLIEYSDMPLEQKRIDKDYRLISKRIVEY